MIREVIIKQKATGMPMAIRPRRTKAGFQLFHRRTLPILFNLLQDQDGVHDQSKQH